MRAYAKPVMVFGLGQKHQDCRVLESVPLRSGQSGIAYDERWLQVLIQDHPAMLPIGEIEPGLAEVVPICIELRVPSGYVDNLMITPDGGLVVIETKLWRNPEARREVVGQVLDYAKDLSRFSFEDLQGAVQTARKDRTAKLFTMVRPEASPEEEAPFIDAVSRNLRLGRMLLIIAGDGVQESAEDLTDFLQRHLGLHFTLAMVEMSMWKSPDDDRVLVQPRVLAKTVQIERAIIRLEQGVTAISPARIEPATPSASRPTTITAETFYEELGKHGADLPAKLKAFLADIGGLGVEGDVKSGMRLIWSAPDGRTATLANIDAPGRVYTDAVHSIPLLLGRVEISDRYKTALAAAIPNGEVEASGKPWGLRLSVNGKSPMLAQLLASASAWRSAMVDYIDSLSDAMS